MAGDAVDLPKGGEAEALSWLEGVLPGAPPGEVWYGDDAAVVALPGGGSLLLAADTVVAGVDADLSLTSLADLGWKALAVNLSDIAAMGGRPGHALFSVVGLALRGLAELYEGALAAAERFGCPIVGGDLSGGSQVVVSVSVTGWADGPAVLRSGASPGDTVWVTGALGAAAAGLRSLRERPDATSISAWASSGGLQLPANVQAHARPVPALGEGRAARAVGATSMIDVSDGLLADLGHLAEASGVGIDIGEVPVAQGATLEEALAGGDDYVLVFTTPRETLPGAAFATAGLPEPFELGRCVGNAVGLRLRGTPVTRRGWSHRLAT